MARRIVETILSSPDILNRIDEALDNRRNNSQNAENEVRRLFNPQVLTQSRPAFQFTRNFRGEASRGSINMRRRCLRNASAPFCREVCLLTSPETSVVPRGMARVQLLNDGYIVSGVQFQKTWTAQEVLQHIRYIYDSKLQNSTEIEILRASSTHLVKPALERGIEMSGSLLCTLFKDRVIYIRPSVNLSQLDQNSTQLLTPPVLAPSPVQAGMQVQAAAAVAAPSNFQQSSPVQTTTVAAPSNFQLSLPDQTTTVAAPSNFQLSSPVQTTTVAAPSNFQQSSPVQTTNVAAPSIFQLSLPDQTTTVAAPSNFQLSSPVQTTTVAAPSNFQLSSPVQTTNVAAPSIFQLSLPDQTTTVAAPSNFQLSSPVQTTTVAAPSNFQLSSPVQTTTVAAPSNFQLSSSPDQTTPVAASNLQPMSPDQIPAMDNDGAVLHEWINAGTPDVYYRIIQPATDEHSSTEVLIGENLMVLSDEEEEPVMLRSPSKTNTEDDEEDLADILTSFQKENLDTQDHAVVVARRSKILQSACQALSKNYFAWHRTPRIEFVGESAEDFGGPQREFFRLLMIEVQSALGIFEGKQGQVFFAYNQTALEQNRFYTGGKLIAWSILHGGPGIKALHSALYLLMCGQEGQLDKFDFQDLPDNEVHFKMQQILHCTSVSDLISLKANLGDWIADCGVPWIYSAGLSDMLRVYSLVIKHFIYLRPASMISQFKAGVNSCGLLWQVVENNWKVFKPLFTNTQKSLSRSEFRDLLVVNWSQEGSNRREAEEETIFSWECLLNSIQEKACALTFEDLLTFLSGADCLPPLGFHKKAEIDFYTQDNQSRRIPFASTCSMVLFLPRGVQDETELEKLLIEAVKGSVGFGKF